MSRKYRSTAQWLELIEAFEQSDQSQVNFCAKHKLNPAYFSKRRGELLQPDDQSTFVQVQPKPAKIVDALYSATDFGTSLTLRFQQAELTLPISVEPRWLAVLIKELST